MKVFNPRKRHLAAYFASLDYKLVQAYYSSDQWKTDAPPEAIYDIIKKHKEDTYGRDSEEYLKNVNTESPFRKVLEKPREAQADLERGEEILKVEENKPKVLRKYFMPTEPNWGPKSRATGNAVTKKD